MGGDVLRTYDVKRTLGVGGMATVVLARLDDGRDVAVKQLHPFLADDPASYGALLDELHLTAAVRHPNVVRMIGVVEGVVGAPAIAMEWVDGVDLGKLAQAAERAGVRLPVDVVAAIARDVLAGLHAAHEARNERGVALEIVHRDVSPQNLLLGRDGVARVTDFGVARAIDRLHQTERGAIKGKLGYLAPEQLAGVCDRRTDVFGVGAVLWELLTGTRMRSGDGVEMLVQIVTGRTDAPSAQRPEAACLDAVVVRALDTIPELRFASAEEMANAIVAAVEPASASRVAEVVAALLEDAPQTSGMFEADTRKTETALALGSMCSHSEAVSEATVPLELDRSPSHIRRAATRRRGPPLARATWGRPPLPTSTHRYAEILTR